MNSPAFLALVPVILLMSLGFLAARWGWIRAAAVKNLAFPCVVAACGWALGLHGLALSVMVVASSLPVGANVFLFALRYGVAPDEVTASIAVSTALALVTVPVVLLLTARFL